MTNKMPVVGKRYKLKSGKNMIVRILPIITVVQEEIGGTIEYGVEVFNTIFEELPQDNSQETEECCPIETAEAAWNMSEVNETPNPVDFEKEEVNEVDRALEELKKHFATKELTFNQAMLYQETTARLAQNLVNVLEVEKSEMNLVKDTLKEGIKQMKDFNAKMDEKYPMSKPEPKWLSISCAPKDGSVIIVQQKDNKRHKIFKAQWFLNKWYSLYEEGGNEEVYPEFWLEGSKEEPKIDIKEEHVDPVSIWKDVSESIYHCNFSPDQLCLYEKFIEFFEQMQKDIEELKKK